MKEDSYREWTKQADYDMDTAEFMFKGGRHFYAVFMCHLSIEKALKGLFQFMCHQLPPKTHSLVYLLEKTGVRAPDAIGRFLVGLSEAHVVTRYPEDIEDLKRAYTPARVKGIIENAKETLEWIKQQLSPR